MVIEYKVFVNPVLGSVKNCSNQVQNWHSTAVKHRNKHNSEINTISVVPFKFVVGIDILIVSLSNLFSIPRGRSTASVATPDTAIINCFKNVENRLRYNQQYHLNTQIGAYILIPFYTEIGVAAL